MPQKARMFAVALLAIGAILARPAPAAPPVPQPAATSPAVDQQTRIAQLIAQLPGQDMGARMRAKTAHEQLVAIGRPAVPALIQALSHPDSGTRMWAAGALGDIADPRAKEPMIPLLADKHPLVRQVTVWHTRRWLADPRIREATIALAHAPNSEVAKWAKRALDEHDKQLLLREIKKDIAAPDPALREAALAELEQRLDKKAYGEILLDRLENDPSGPIRAKALKALLPRDDLHPRVTPILILWLEKTPEAWTPEERDRALKIARLTLARINADPFAARNDIPPGESPQDEAKRWRQWLSAHPAPQK